MYKPNGIELEQVIYRATHIPTAPHLEPAATEPDHRLTRQRRFDTLGLPRTTAVA